MKRRKIARNEQEGMNRENPERTPRKARAGAPDLELDLSWLDEPIVIEDWSIVVPDVDWEKVLPDLDWGAALPDLDWEKVLPDDVTQIDVTAEIQLPDIDWEKILPDEARGAADEQAVT